MTAPADPFQARICISFALPQEYAPFRRYERSLRPMVNAGYSGAGARNAQRQVSRLLAAMPSQPDALVVCGFAGALGPLEAGDIVIADRVVDCTGRNGVNTEYRADSRLLATAESVRLSRLTIRCCTLATTDRVLLNGDEKRAFLGRFPHAQCVDMETAGALQVATERGIPWLAVRVITDGPDDALPLDFNALAAPDGDVALARVILATLMHPGKIPALLQLGKRATLAADNLTAFLLELLPLIPAADRSL